MPDPAEEARREVARRAILGEGGVPPGVPGTGRDVREVPRGEFENIDKDLREGLGDPDRGIQVPGKGTVEIWRLASGENVTYRSFSTSGAKGLSEPETIDIGSVPGFDGVQKIHITKGS